MKRWKRKGSAKRWINGQVKVEGGKKMEIHGEVEDKLRRKWLKVQ